MGNAKRRRKTKGERKDEASYRTFEVDHTQGDELSMGEK